MHHRQPISDEWIKVTQTLHRARIKAVAAVAAEKDDESDLVRLQLRQLFRKRQAWTVWTGQRQSRIDHRQPIVEREPTAGLLGASCDGLAKIAQRLPNALAIG